VSSGETSPGPSRGLAVTERWDTDCKDCRAEMTSHGYSSAVGSGKRSSARSAKRSKRSAEFSYSGEWARRILELGQSRSDRCPACRLRHKQMIQAYAVAYVDVTAIGQVADPADPSGPLGGLGPLPVRHTWKEKTIDLAKFEFGLGDADIVDLLHGLSGDKRVAVLEAGTGTGKSTFGPFRLMKPPARPLRTDGRPPFTPTDNGPIIVTEPRIPATTGVATFVGEQLCFGHENCTEHIGPGFPVGYQKAGEKHWDGACQLIYVTDGTMVNWIRQGRLAQIGMVIVDEAHERSENIDLILALLRDQLPRFPHLRVIIASATIDKNFFIQYFGGEDKVHHQHVEAVKGVGYGVPFFPDLVITNEIIRDGLEEEPPLGRFEPWPATGIDGENLHAHTQTLLALKTTQEIPVEEWKKRMPQAVAQQALRLLEGTDPDSGDILAFLPTTSMINEACKRIERGVRGQQIKVYPLLSSVDDRIKKAALEPSKSGQRKVVVSSNLAETSLTVSGVRYLIDSGLICQSEWDPQLAQESLPSKPHSQSGVRQRWGRVGRNQPGWVFPLYTRAQFIDLMPRDTPAGSTRANLEQFLVKMKAAGIDRPSEVELPGDFANDAYEPPDGHGKAASAVFKMEITRAERALAANGAVDADGHLTGFGRELERFRGPPEHAIAIMFADRLACVPEVGMALSLLSNGRLVDRKALLWFDPDWPPSWRVQATLSHKALALGCEDDLDLVLRISAEWERAPDPEAWAHHWWVSHELLEAAKEEKTALVAALSPAMKKEAERPIELSLIPKSRAVMSRALASLTYKPGTDPGTWQLELDDAAPPVERGRRQLTPVTGRLLALSRFRPPGRRGAPPPKPVIQGLIRVVDWAREVLESGCEPDPFELLVLAADKLKEATDSEADPCTTLRATFPVGCVVSVGEVSLDGASRRLIRLQGPPDPGGDLPSLDGEAGDEEDDELVVSPRAARRRGLRSADEEAASFDVKRPPLPGSEKPDEERAVALRDIRALEHNDPESSTEANDSPAIDPKPSPAPIASDSVSVPVVWEGPAPEGPEVFGWVTGYHINESGAAVVLRQQEGPDARGLSQPSFSFGESIDVTVLGTAEDHDHKFRILEVEGGQVLESQMAGAFDRFNQGWILELTKGTTWPAVVVPGYGAKDPYGVTLLPELYDYFAALEAKGGRRVGERWYPATIVPVTQTPNVTEDSSLESEFGVGMESEATTPDFRPQAKVQLHVPATLDPAPFRFMVDEAKLRRNTGLEKDGEVEVKISGFPVELRTPPRGADDIFAKLAGELEESEKGQGWSTAGTGPLSEETRSILLSAAPNNPRWERAVWRCWLESYRLRVWDVRSVGSHHELRIPTALVPAMKRAGIRKDVGQKHDVTLYIDKDTGIASADGEPASAAAALRELEEIVFGSSVFVDLPPDPARLKRLNRPESKESTVKHIERIRATPGILACDLDFSTATLTLVANNESTLEEAVERVRSLVAGAEGIVTLSDASYIGRVKGTKGAVLEMMRLASGCTETWGPPKESGSLEFRVSGPTRANLERFLAQVRTRDVGAQLEIVGEYSIGIRRTAAETEPEPIAATGSLAELQQELDELGTLEEELDVSLKSVVADSRVREAKPKVSTTPVDGATQESHKQRPPPASPIRRKPAPTSARRRPALIALGIGALLTLIGIIILTRQTNQATQGRPLNEARLLGKWEANARVSTVKGLSRTGRGDRIPFDMLFEPKCRKGPCREVRVRLMFGRATAAGLLTRDGSTYAGRISGHVFRDRPARLGQILIRFAVEDARRLKGHWRANAIRGKIELAAAPRPSQSRVKLTARFKGHL
jgi:HrpA-like RNA helicase